jgi:hypothetical protein
MVVARSSEMIQRRRYCHLIVRAARDLESRYSYELTDDLEINSDNKPIQSGLKNHPIVTILNHLKVDIK